MAASTKINNVDIKFSAIDRNLTSNFLQHGQKFVDLTPHMKLMEGVYRLSKAVVTCEALMDDSHDDANNNYNIKFS